MRWLVFETGMIQIATLKPTFVVFLLFLDAQNEQKVIKIIEK